MIQLREKTFSIKAARRRPLNVLNYSDAPGHVAILTHYGERKYVIMSMHTYTQLLEHLQKCESLLTTFEPK